MKGQQFVFRCRNVLNLQPVVINEIFSPGFLTEDKMTLEITTLSNYKKLDYKPLMDFAKKKRDCVFIATNIPERYASMINSMGMEPLRN